MKKLAVMCLLALGACNRAAPASSTGGDKFRTISKGTAFAQKDYVEAGKVSVLVLTADW
jgi:hypothetical protein